MKPRGIRNNNPGNLRGSSAYEWNGEIGRDDANFVIFDKPEMGIRAMYRTLMTYRNHYGLDTVQSIIKRWAPSDGHANGQSYSQNTGAYIAHVANKLGVMASQPLSLGQYPALIEAMILHENGQQPYSMATIEEGIALA